MNWNQVKQFGFRWHRIDGEFELFPYQIAFGISLRYLSCLKSLSFRFYFLVFKLWFNISLESKE